MRSCSPGWPTKQATCLKNSRWWLRWLSAGASRQELAVAEADAARVYVAAVAAAGEAIPDPCLLPSHPAVGRRFLRSSFSVRSGELTGVLGDVSGKGIPAALLSSLTLGALNMEFRSAARPDLVLNSVNKVLCEKTPAHRFVTLFLFQLDANGNGHFISAGHNPASICFARPLRRR